MKDLLLKQQYHMNRWNEIPHGDRMKLYVLSRSLTSNQCTFYNVVNNLCLLSYLKLKKICKRMADYELKYISDTHVYVKSISHSKFLHCHCYCSSGGCQSYFTLFFKKIDK